MYLCSCSASSLHASTAQPASIIACKTQSLLPTCFQALLPFLHMHIPYTVAHHMSFTTRPTCFAVSISDFVSVAMPQDEMVVEVPLPQGGWRKFGLNELGSSWPANALCYMGSWHKV